MPSKPTALEHDFLGLDRRNAVVSSSSSKSQLRRIFDRQRSFRDVQNAIAKINPELLKASMAGSTSSAQDSAAFKFDGAIFDSRKSMSVPSSPRNFTALPVYTNPGIKPAMDQASKLAGSAAPAPLTIFYNGTVSVFDLPPHKVETILKLAEEGRVKNPSEEPKSSSTKDWIAQSKRRMLQRNVSLQRFLEKRKERLTAMPVQIGDGNRKKKDAINV